MCRSPGGTCQAESRWKGQGWGKLVCCPTTNPRTLDHDEHRVEALGCKALCGLVPLSHTHLFSCSKELKICRNSSMKP